jgi:regulator of RNase E activity RraA
MPCWARGHTHRGPGKEGPGAINVPVACAGLVVQPGDLVLADADGVIAIPQDELAALMPKVHAPLAHEASIREINASGAGDPDRFDKLLRAKGVPA